MADIVHRIGIRAPAAQVYQAIASRKGLARWWTNDVSGDEGLQGKLGFRFFTKAGALVGEMLMQVTALNRDSSVRWRCLEGPPEWVGTDLSFELTEADGMTIVLFAHRHWRETVEFTHHCSTKWAVFILSLRESVESGKGRPSPDDVKIDNWN